MSEDRTAYLPCKVLTMAQGTHEWHQARIGHVTSSEITAIITPCGVPTNSKTRQSYANQLAWERITKRPKDSVSVYSIDRGHDLEGIARCWYYTETRNPVVQVGFCDKMDGINGCSPDGLVGDDGMTEIKCFLDRRYADILVSGEIDGKIMMQMQHQMYVTGRAWNDFVLYTDVQPFSGIIERVMRDPIMIGKIHNAVQDFKIEVEESYQTMIRKAKLTPDKLDFPAPVFNEDGEEVLTTGTMEGSEL